MLPPYITDKAQMQSFRTFAHNGLDVKNPILRKFDHPINHGYLDQ